MSEDKFNGSGQGDLASWVGWRDAPLVLKILIVLLPAAVLGGLAGALFGRGIYDLWIGNDDGAYKVLITLAGAIGAPFVAWRTIVAHQQTGIARETHYTTLFTKAVEQLGITREVSTSNTADGAAIVSVSHTEPNFEVRLGAIYALERIAQDSTRDHCPIMEVLCSYVRNPQNCGVPLARPEEMDGKRVAHWTINATQIRADVQAALNVIGRRSSDRIAHEHKLSFKLDFSRANLQRAVLSGDFSEAIWSGANLAGAEIRRCILSKGWLDNLAQFDDIRFFETNLVGVNTDFLFDEITGMTFQRCSFTDSDLSAAIIFSATFIDCDLSGLSFESCTAIRANFHRCNLSGAIFDEATFENCRIGNCRLEGVSFRGADLTGLRGLTEQDVAKTFGSSTTLLSPKLTRPSSWPPSFAA